MINQLKVLITMPADGGDVPEQQAGDRYDVPILIQARRSGSRAEKRVGAVPAVGVPVNGKHDVAVNEGRLDLLAAPFPVRS
jgi:hypothetical protein